VLGNVIQLLQCFVLIDFVYKELFLLCSIISVLLHVKCEFLCSFHFHWVLLMLCALWKLLLIDAFRLDFLIWK